MFATGNCSLKRSQISRLLKEKNPDNISIAKDIGNAIAIAKRGKLDGLSNIEAAVERLRNLNWRHSSKEDSASGVVTDLIFTPLERLQLWQHFPSVIFMDCTYKTNKVSIGQLIIRKKLSENFYCKHG